MIKFPPSIWLLLFVSIAHSFENDDISSVLDFSTNNGKRYLNILTLDHQDPNVGSAMKQFIFLAKLKGSIYIRNSKLVDQNLDIESMKFHQDSLVILASGSDTKNWEIYVKMIT